MNVLFLSLLYHPDALHEVSERSRVGLQNQANGFQWAMIDGIKMNLIAGETLSILNSLPVGIYPRQYDKLILRHMRQDDRFTEIGGINLPYVKQKQRQRAAEKHIKAWAAQSHDNRTVVLYSLYLPYLLAIAAAKRNIPDLRACIIVTDLPGSLGLSSGRTGILRKIEYRRGDHSMRLAAELSGFILLTEQMAEPMRVTQKKHVVIEGLTAQQGVTPEAIELPGDTRPAVLYTGTLNRELGIGLLLEAFAEIEDLQLWLCGRGDMEAEIHHAQKKRNNIRYFGFVPQPQAAYLQTKASVLINPRTNQGVYTRYSFPSKTMEYMRSGTPVLCCKLDGMPPAYDQYLTYIEPQNALGIRSALQEMMARTKEERSDLGRRARTYVLQEKNNEAQGRKAVELLRSL